ncbi:MAG: Eco57I restriction-modification methylase domain-containing protein, partial [Pyrinomonadaceae bacterium]
LGTFSVTGEAKIVSPFELKGAATKDLDAIMPGRHKSPVQQAWEYAMDAPGAQWVLLSNYREIRLYAIGYGRKDYETFDLTTLAKSCDYYQRFMLLLSARNLLSGKTVELLTESDTVGKEITNQLYTEYKADRSLLIDEINATNRKIDAQIALRVAQTILDRILFIAFAEDRGLLKKSTLKETFKAKNPFNPQPVWRNFIGLFQAIDKGSPSLNIPGYNGGLFATDKYIEELEISDELCSRLAGLGEYDYESDVSVNILGHIFEQSISDLEELKHSLEPDTTSFDVGSKRRTDGIFYTPSFVTRIVVEQTVGRWLADQKAELGFDAVKPLTNADYA